GGGRYRSSGHDGDARSDIYRLCPDDLRSAASLWVHCQVRAFGIGAQSAGNASWHRLSRRLDAGRHVDPFRTGCPHCHDARRHPCVLGVAGSRRATRASSRDGARRHLAASLSNADDSGGSHPALHAGHGAVTARSSRLYSCCAWYCRRVEWRDGWNMSRLLPFPIVSASLLVLWLPLNQTLSPGQILLGGAIALVGG